MAYNTTQAGRTDTLVAQSNGMQFCSGTSVFDATAITTTDSAQYNIGFKPKYILFVNLTDRVSAEWYEGMTTSQNLKASNANVTSLNTTALGIEPQDRGFAILQNAALALILASKTCVFFAQG